MKQNTDATAVVLKKYKKPNKFKLWVIHVGDYFTHYPKYFNRYWATTNKKIKKYKMILWFILPAMLFAFVFSYIPMIGTLIAFKGDFNLYLYDPLGAFFNAGWTMENFVKIFNDAAFVDSLNNTLIISGLKILVVFPISIFIAIMLSELKSQSLAKVILIVLCLPNFLSWTVVNGLFKNFLSDQGGLLNIMLIKMGIIEEEFWFYGSNAAFKPLVLFLSAWKTSGWNCIMFYSAIMAIDKSFYEAAEIDGVSKAKRMVHLTIPSIMPMIALMLVMNITYILDAGFEQVYTMMTSETRYTQQILGTYLYDISIANRSDTPFATALGVFNGTISLAFMLIGNKMCRKFLGRGLW